MIQAPCDISQGRGYGVRVRTRIVPTATVVLLACKPEAWVACMQGVRVSG